MAITFNLRHFRAGAHHRLWLFIAALLTGRSVDAACRLISAPLQAFNPCLQGPQAVPVSADLLTRSGRSAMIVRRG